MSLDESQLESATLSWFADLGFAEAHGPNIAPDGAAHERDSFGDVMLVHHLRNAIRRLHPEIPAYGLDDIRFACRFRDGIAVRLVKQSIAE